MMMPKKDRVAVYSHLFKGASAVSLLSVLDQGGHGVRGRPCASVAVL